MRAEGRIGPGVGKRRRRVVLDPTDKKQGVHCPGFRAVDAASGRPRAAGCDVRQRVALPRRRRNRIRDRGGCGLAPRRVEERNGADV